MYMLTVCAQDQEQQTSSNILGYMEFMYWCCLLADGKFHYLSTAFIQHTTWITLATQARKTASRRTEEQSRLYWIYMVFLF